MKRQIGIIGTLARIILGSILFGSALYGHLHGVFRPLPWIIGLVIFPMIFILWQWRQVRNKKDRFQKTGLLAICINILIFVAFYFTYWYAPAIKFMSDAVLIFYGFSMLLAAIRGYAGCEVLAISNWVLNRDDQIGCLIFKPFDKIDMKLQGQSENLNKLNR